MKLEEMIISESILDKEILSTEEEIEQYIKESLKPENIIAVFNNYIIKHNIIGIDKINNNSFWKDIADHANHISKSINNYNFSPYLEKLLLKGRNKLPRIISIPTIKDRIILYILKELLHKVFHGSVSRQLVNNKIKEISKIILKNEAKKVIKIDLKGFYDSINQEILLDKIRKKINSNLFLSLLDNAITNPTVPKNYIRDEKENYFQYLGIPQGLAISNILADIFLKEFDDSVINYCNYYYRYVDDILIFCTEENYKEIKRKVTNDLQRLGLEINDKKTKIYEITDEFIFLGYKIKQQSITVKNESLQKHINSLFALFTNYKNLFEKKVEREEWLTNELLENRLESDINEKITGAISEKKKYGWLFYYNVINDMSLLYKLNKILHDAMRRILPSNIISKLKIKSYVRAYHEIKNNPKGGYIENYDLYDTIIKRLNYLVFRGYINKEGQYSEEEIDYKFKIVREGNISRMQRDIGSLS